MRYYEQHFRYVFFLGSALRDLPLSQILKRQDAALSGASLGGWW